MPVPQPKANELIDKINQLKMAEQPNLFALASIKRDAERLVKAGAGVGYTLLGMVACIEDNEAEMRHFHRAAIANSL